MASKLFAAEVLTDDTRAIHLHLYVFYCLQVTLAHLTMIVIKRLEHVGMQRAKVRLQVCVCVCWQWL